jgi:hypothetical protein
MDITELLPPPLVQRLFESLKLVCDVNIVYVTGNVGDSNQEQVSDQAKKVLVIIQLE